MKTHFLLIIAFLVTTLSVQAQSASPQVVAAGGGDYAGSDLLMSWTVGEAVIATLQTADTYLSQGFHQPDLMVTPVGEVDELEGYRVFPNPVSQALAVELPEGNRAKQLILTDLTGRLMQNWSISAGDREASLDVSRFASGQYVLTISADGRALGSFQVVKIR